MTIQSRQQGGSAIGLVIFLVILAYAVYVGIQYVPQHIESSAVDTILNNVIEKHKTENLGDMNAVQSAIDNQLYVNQMSDLKDSFTVTQNRGKYVITVSYERELNLVYEKKLMPYQKTVTLD